METFSSFHITVKADQRLSAIPYILVSFPWDLSQLLYQWTSIAQFHVDLIYTVGGSGSHGDVKETANNPSTIL